MVWNTRVSDIIYRPWPKDTPSFGHLAFITPAELWYTADWSWDALTLNTTFDDYLNELDAIAYMEIQKPGDIKAHFHD